MTTKLVVRGNPVLLREVIANLLDNALKYVPLARPDGARITVNVARGALEDGQPAAEIVVEDNGPGVPANQQADLFKRFFRGDAQSGNGVETGAGPASRSCTTSSRCTAAPSRTRMHRKAARASW